MDNVYEKIMRGIGIILGIMVMIFLAVGFWKWLGICGKIFNVN